jgi:hypothetical protein
MEIVGYKQLRNSVKKMLEDGGYKVDPESIALGIAGLIDLFAFQWELSKKVEIEVLDEKSLIETIIERCGAKEWFKDYLLRLHERFDEDDDFELMIVKAKEFAQK